MPLPPSSYLVPGYLPDDYLAATQYFIDPYWEGFTALEMVQAVRRRLGVGPNDENRYPKADVILALNMGATRFAKLTACLLHPIVVIGKANQMNYRAPYGTLRIMAARYYTGTTKQDYYELKIIRDMRAMQRKDNFFRGNSGQPEWLFPTYRAGNVLNFGVSPYPSSDGSVWTASSYGLLATATGYQTAGQITGMHKAGYAASAFLVDSLGRDLTVLGALVGYPVLNITQNQSAVITAIGDQDATNDKVVGVLSGAATWQPGDVFVIPMNEYGVVVDGNNETYTIANYLGTIGDIAGNTGNMVLDVARTPLPLSVTLDGQHSEIPATYQEAQIAFAVYWLASGMFGGTTQNIKAEAALQVFGNYVAEYNSGDEMVEIYENAIEDHDWWD